MGKGARVWGCFVYDLINLELLNVLRAWLCVYVCKMLYNPERGVYNIESQIGQKTVIQLKSFAIIDIWFGGSESVSKYGNNEFINSPLD